MAYMHRRKQMPGEEQGVQKLRGERTKSKRCRKIGESERVARRGDTEEDSEDSGTGRRQDTCTPGEKEKTSCQDCE